MSAFTFRQQVRRLWRLRGMGGIFRKADNSPQWFRMLWNASAAAHTFNQLDCDNGLLVLNMYRQTAQDLKIWSDDAIIFPLRPQSGEKVSGFWLAEAFIRMGIPPRGRPDSQVKWHWYLDFDCARHLGLSGGIPGRDGAEHFANANCIADALSSELGVAVKHWVPYIAVQWNHPAIVAFEKTNLKS